MSSMAKDYYDILGVKKNASDKEVRQAYRRLARKHHPDVNRSDPASEQRFKEVNEAYQVLSDPESRRKYDRYGENWKYADRIAQEEAAAGRRGPFTSIYRGGGQAPEDLLNLNLGDAGLGDLFGEFFGRRTSTRPRRQQRLEQSVEVTLEEAYQGATRVLTLTNPDGSQRRLEVKVPPGVDTGSRVRISPDGQQGTEVTLVVTVQPHRIFQRKGRDLHTEVSVPLYDAFLGGEIQVPTLKGRVALTVPPETQNGKVFRLSGQGMPLLDKPDVKGDLLATVKVTLPQKLSEEEQGLIRHLKELRSE